MTKDGEIWGLGSNTFGQLGKSSSERPTSTELSKIEINGKVNAVKCGKSHTVIKIDGGDILACGSNSFGQLGFETQIEQVECFMEILLPSNSINDFSCGPTASVFLDSQNQQIYMCGTIDEDTKMHGVQPIHLPDELRNQTMTQVKCGSKSILVLTSNGSVFSKRGD